MHPKQLTIADFNYHLPPERIAAYPLAERDSSRLLIYKNGQISEDIYRNIDQYVPAKSAVIFNNTKVIEARVLFKKPTGAVVEIFCLDPDPVHGDVHSALNTQSSVAWKCLIGGASKWKAGQVLEKKLQANGVDITLQAKYLHKAGQRFAIHFSWIPATLSFADILHAAGAIPLPPYIKRKPEESDKERYQTVFAEADGSVAAPTAGLHFTDAVIQKLKAKNIVLHPVTLHVGAGTFQPVKSDTMEGHHMHSEYVYIQADTIEILLAFLGKGITAIGTTSLRTLETIYWLGVKTLLYPDAPLKDIQIQQWDPYDLSASVGVKGALTALLRRMMNENLATFITQTSLLIAPGYAFRIVDILITNFHQPRSTLLLLVAAFVGRDWQKIYDYALEKDFRFLSYGDGCVLFRPLQSSKEEFQ